MRNNKPGRCLSYCYLAKPWTFTVPCFRAYPQGLAVVKAALRPPIHHRTFSFPLHGAFMGIESQRPTQSYAGALTKNKGKGSDKKQCGRAVVSEVATSFLQGVCIILQAPARVRCPLKMHITTVYICRRCRSALSGAGNVCPGFNLCHAHAGRS